MHPWQPRGDVQPDRVTQHSGKIKGRRVRLADPFVHPAWLGVYVREDNPMEASRSGIYLALSYAQLDGADMQIFGYSGQADITDQKETRH